MRKLKLSLEGLRVESFEVTTGEAERRGTVRGHSYLCTDDWVVITSDDYRASIGSCQTDFGCAPVLPSMNLPGALPIGVEGGS